MAIDMEREREKHRWLSRRMSEILSTVKDGETAVLLYRKDDCWSITASAPVDQHEELKPVLDLITAILNGLDPAEVANHRKLLEFSGKAVT